MSSSSPVPSPCINVCRIDPGSGLCVGCRRSLDEIAAWGGYSEEQKRRLIRELPARRAGKDEPGPGR